ncbi:hypothetical protein GCM10007416_07830 [Kroppenstedtia guangzhouensis]|uniref:Uncharacterized protein n=1 Tax=Kroppenstedtia guangzhouensis TaxID=1274356 RepID=A0ABQ1G4G8_9BACL|nr:hypothetical protein GCM10007416_07830 [Kroppenstedtia guangzhouensis]
MVEKYKEIDALRKGDFFEISIEKSSIDMCCIIGNSNLAWQGGWGNRGKS